MPASASIVCVEFGVCVAVRVFAAAGKDGGTVDLHPNIKTNAKITDVRKSILFI